MAMAQELLGRSETGEFTSNLLGKGQDSNDADIHRKRVTLLFTGGRERGQGMMFGFLVIQ
jgi:hypothetical protein